MSWQICLVTEYVHRLDFPFQTWLSKTSTCSASIPKSVTIFPGQIVMILFLTFKSYVLSLRNEFLIAWMMVKKKHTMTLFGHSVFGPCGSLELLFWRKLRYYIYRWSEMEKNQCQSELRWQQNGNQVISRHHVIISPDSRFCRYSGVRASVPHPLRLNLESCWWRSCSGRITHFIVDRSVVNCAGAPVSYSFFLLISRYNEFPSVHLQLSEFSIASCDYFH